MQLEDENAAGVYYKFKNKKVRHLKDISIMLSEEKNEQTVFRSRQTKPLCIGLLWDEQDVSDTATEACGEGSIERFSICTQQ